MERIILKGLATSPGIGMGHVYLYNENNINIHKEKIDNVDIELERLKGALIETKEELDFLYKKSVLKIGREDAGIFLAHASLLEDPELHSDIKDYIIKNKVNSEWAIKEVIEKYIRIFNDIEDIYIKERCIDLKDVSNRIIRTLMNIEHRKLKDIEEESILIAEVLTPSDTVELNRDTIIAICTEYGGMTSHSSIIAKTLGIPSVVGVENIIEYVNHGDYIIVDGNNGEIIVNPSREEKLEYTSLLEDEDLRLARYKSLINMPSISKDEYKVKIMGNIGTPLDVDYVMDYGGEGIGLVRTEFMYMDREDLPSEDEQFNVYKEIVEKANGKEVTIRTLDAGGDKEVKYLETLEEMNPFLGYRAIRLCLDRDDIFIPQLKAICRASIYGEVKIMFPMISSIGELRRAKEKLEEAKVELRKEGKLFNEDIEIGIMVEVPSVAIMAREFAKYVDFFSIGTNDLIQYTVAVDRENQNVSNLYTRYHPAVLRLIKYIIDSGHDEGIKVAMCGETAGDKNLIPLLLGMGLDEFSMASSNILEARYIINNTLKEEMEKEVEYILGLETKEEIKEYILNLNR